MDEPQVAPFEKTAPSSVDPFGERFLPREGAETYRDRFACGHRARIDRLERAALRQLLSSIDRVSVALDIPCGTGRLSSLLGEAADRVLLCDASETMLDLARQHVSGLDAEYLQTRCESIALPDKSVGLVFCHRFLHHVYERVRRLQVLREFARVSSQYVVLNHYPPGIRTRTKRLFRTLIRGARAPEGIASASQLSLEAQDAGLRWLGTVYIRRFPIRGSFLLFLVS